MEWVPHDPVTVGHAEADTGPAPASAIAAVLWVPDPEQRHGWREVYVRRDQPKRAGKVGFGR